MATQKKGGGISWCEETWNPIVGCSVVSPGCTNCYAMVLAGNRLDREGGPAHYRGLTIDTKVGPVWNGKVNIAPERIVTQPLRWNRPRVVFTNSMGDVFHENALSEWIDRVFAVMALTPRHTYQMLTKRHARMRSYINDPATRDRVFQRAAEMAGNFIVDTGWPLANLWLGVSVEDQARAQPRLSALIQTLAAVRWVSYEPAIGSLYLGAVTLTAAEVLANTGKLDLYHGATDLAYTGHDVHFYDLGGIHWIVYGEESGHDARPGNQDWARVLLEETRRYHSPPIAFFMKQLQSEGGGKILKDLADFPPDLRVRQYPERPAG